MEKEGERFIRRLKEKVDCMPNKLKKPGTFKGWMGLIICARLFDFFGRALKKLPPIAAAHRGLIRASTLLCSFNRPSRPVHGGSSTGHASLLPCDPDSPQP